LASAAALLRYWRASVRARDIRKPPALLAVTPQSLEIGDRHAAIFEPEQPTPNTPNATLMVQRSNRVPAQSASRGDR
jgi:hypothetical protein